jgi:3'-5' exoribonuclease
MRHVNSLSEIDYSQQETITFEATVLDLVHEGDAERRFPMKFNLKFESSGDVVQVVSWTYELLDSVKDAANNTNVMLLDGVAGIFKDQTQIRVGSVKDTGKKSLRKIIEVINPEDIKKDIYAILNKYISTQSIRDMLDEMVLNNDKFYVWPAATRIHHAYPGGLAKHTLQVCRHAINTWEQYEGKDLDIEVIVAGALLHDIGKLTEYAEDGSRTIFGDLVSHIVDGSEKVAEWCWKHNIDSNKDKKMVMIKHVILSHHEKPEFGAAVTPAILEAVVVARADNLDATIEGIKKEVNNLSVGNFTNKLMAADGTKILKWQ